MLVTGVNGFVGKHLARELKEQGDEIIGVGREDRPSSELKGLLADYYICDLMDQAAVAKLPLEGVNVVISLAGLARVGDSFAEPEKYKAVNVGVLKTARPIRLARLPWSRLLRNSEIKGRI